MTQRLCPDCDESMYPITLIDSAASGVDQTLQYAAVEAKRHWFSGQIPKAGMISGYMCEGCGRIALYGHPRGHVLPIPGAGPESASEPAE